MNTKQTSQNLLPDERKQEILAMIKTKSSNGGRCIIYGAAHFQRQEWGWYSRGYYAPYHCHAAIAEWLQSLGFRTSRYCHSGGVEQGLLVEC